MAADRPCANPVCLCQTSDVTCSLWCGTLDRPADVRCLCRHDTCVRPLARTPHWPAAGHAAGVGAGRGYESTDQGTGLPRTA
jgi:hypothetical protein